MCGTMYVFTSWVGMKCDGGVKGTSAPAREVFPTSSIPSFTPFSASRPRSGGVCFVFSGEQTSAIENAPVHAIARSTNVGTMTTHTGPTTSPRPLPRWCCNLHARYLSKQYIHPSSRMETLRETPRKTPREGPLRRRSITASEHLVPLPPYRR